MGLIWAYSFLVFPLIQNTSQSRNSQLQYFTDNYKIHNLKKILHKAGIRVEVVYASFVFRVIIYVYIYVLGDKT